MAHSIIAITITKCNRKVGSMNAYQSSVYVGQPTDAEVKNERGKKLE
jgi:hypothetical protein